MDALQRLLSPFRQAQTYRSLAFLLSGIPFGILWLILLVTGYATSLPLLITIIGIPVLLGFIAALRGAAVLERTLLRDLLGVDLAPVRHRPRRRGGVLERLLAWLRDPAAWREQGYLVLRTLLGFPLGVAILALIGGGLQWISQPTWYWAAGDGAGFGEAWEIDTFGESIVLVPAGIAVVIAGMHLVTPLARGWARLAEGMLGVRAGRVALDEGPERLARELPSPRVSRRALAIHAAAWAILNLAMVAIWLGTTPGDYFWPMWTMLGPGLPLAAHALIALHPPLGRVPGGPRRALELHAGLWGIIWLFLVAIWAVTTPGDYFWPMWTLIGLTVPPLIHLLAYFARGGDQVLLRERVEVLTTTRAAAVDAQAAELQRIERDLHDGAQARLVALAMDIGMAEEKMAADPEGARRLMAEARDEAKRALVELRDLARGIHPPILTDRGLSAAVSALAARSPVPVTLDVDVPERLAAAVEAAAYFVIAESLTNVAKHSRAGAAHVRLAHRDGELLVEVRDDGDGGADPQGAGLIGLRRRVEALDGRLAVESPAGGPTLVRAVLPAEAQRGRATDRLAHPPPLW